MKVSFFFYALAFTSYTSSIIVKADNPHGWEPSVSLSADLDEPQQFGFCIDFAGPPTDMLCDELQARSCKRFGDDTQFEYYLPTKAIRSVNYNFNCEAGSDPSTRGCVMVSESDGLVSGATLDVVPCNATDERQIFELVESGDNYELQVGEDLCLSVSDTSMPPGPIAPPLAVKRFLTVTTCSSLPGERKTWTIKPRPNEATQTGAPTAAPLFNFGTPPFLFIFFNFIWDPIKYNLFSGWLDFLT